MLVFKTSLRSLVVCVLAAGLPGCAIGSYGALLTRQTHTPTAMVVDLYSLGLHVRPSQPDAGVSAGYRRTSYVYPRPRGDHRSSGTAWRWFGVALPTTPPLLTAATVLGLEAQATPHVRRVALGYVSYALLLGPTVDDSRVVDIRYALDDPSRTYVHDEETNR